MTEATPLAQLRRQQPERLLFECVAGSRAYGTADTHSDVDLRGVFVQPLRELVRIGEPVALIADDRHDQVYYSLRRMLELLAQANPNVLELLWMPDDCVRMDSPEMQRLRERRAIFVTRQCIDTHVGYAIGQIRKARGQHKWINQPKPVDPPRREDYCFVLDRASLITTSEPPCRPQRLRDSKVDLQRCHAAKLEHAPGVYRLYDYGAQARGVFRGDVLALESIPREDESERFIGLLLFAEQPWRRDSEDHRHYWQWRSERNESRWQQQERGELDYDAKNLMHTLRLLLSAAAIVEQGAPRVRFEGAELAFLRSVRNGEHAYQTLVDQAEALRERCLAARGGVSLPESVDPAVVDELLWELTECWEARHR